MFFFHPTLCYLLYFAVLIVCTMQHVFETNYIALVEWNRQQPSTVIQEKETGQFKDHFGLHYMGLRNNFW